MCMRSELNINFLHSKIVGENKINRENGEQISSHIILNSLFSCVGSSVLFFNLSDAKLLKKKAIHKFLILPLLEYEGVNANWNIKYNRNLSAFIDKSDT